jgi:hypothetical protein
MVVEKAPFTLLAPMMFYRRYAAPTAARNACDEEGYGSRGRWVGWTQPEKFSGPSESPGSLHDVVKHAGMAISCAFSGSSTVQVLSAAGAGKKEGDLA